MAVVSQAGNVSEIAGVRQDPVLGWQSPDSRPQVWPADWGVPIDVRTGSRLFRPESPQKKHDGMKAKYI